MTPRKSNLKLATTAEVHDTGKHRRVIVEWSTGQPDLLTLRLEGTRRRYPVELGGLYKLAVMRDVEAQRRERKRPMETKRATKPACITITEGHCWSWIVALPEGADPGDIAARIENAICEHGLPPPNAINDRQITIDDGDDFEADDESNLPGLDSVLLEIEHDSAGQREDDPDLRWRAAGAHFPLAYQALGDRLTNGDLLALHRLIEHGAMESAEDAEGIEAGSVVFVPAGMHGKHRAELEVRINHEIGPSYTVLAGPTVADMREIYEGDMFDEALEAFWRHV